MAIVTLALISLSAAIMQIRRSSVCKDEIERLTSRMPLLFPTPEAKRVHAAINNYTVIRDTGADEKRLFECISSVVDAFEAASDDIYHDGVLVSSVAVFYVLRGYFHRDSGLTELASNDFSKASSLMARSGTSGRRIVLDEAAIQLIVSAESKRWRSGNVTDGATEGEQ